MKKIYSFSNNIYKGNLKKKFFRFSLKKNPKLIKYIFINIKNKILKLFSKKNNYLKQYWSFLDDIDVKNISERFWLKNSKKIDYNKITKNDILIDECPASILEPLTDLNFKTNKPGEFKSILELIEKYAKANDEIYYSKYEKRLKSKNLYILINKKYYQYGKPYFKRISLEYIKYALLILIIGFIISLISLYFATGAFGVKMFLFYGLSKKILILNTIPIIIILAFLTLLFNSLGAGTLITSLISLIMTMANYFKIIFRNDNFVFSDIGLIGEAKEMLNTYTLNFPIAFYLFTILLVIITILIFKKLNQKIDFPKFRILALVLITVISVILYQKIYINPKIYDSLPISPMINTNSATQKYITKGFMYPFIYSTTSKDIEEPVGYNESKAKEILDSYKEENISDDKKVHVISIMLESYSDFSDLGNIQFTKDIYEYFHELQKKSYSGNIISSVFAGGTINTERKFLTGLSYQISPRKPVNSYVYYFNDQGYFTTGMHPGYSWFYNRINVNEYMGFNDYRFWNDTDRVELTDEYLWGDIASDKYVTEDIINQYEKVIKDKKYLFNFSVSYQNHGPQNEEYDGDTYFKKTNSFTDKAYNATNYYFDGIYKTNKQIEALINYFETEKEPVVVILFGDHKPELGTDKTGFKSADINIDITTEEGFRNFYTTPYIIWGNDSAKERLDTDLEGNGPDLTSNFLMGEFFEIAGYKGPKFMQYSNEVKKDINVLHHEAYEEKNKFTRVLSNDTSKKLKEYSNVEYYYYTHFNN